MTILAETSRLTIGTQGRPQIRQLPSYLIDQIAAGEVIAGPASVLKELLDNSLDAGASTITVHLQEAGLKSLSVTDDGCGIPADELSKALIRHATSKLPEDNLAHIETLGFRGEALASMAAVAEVSLQSRPPGQDIAYTVSAARQSLEPTKAPLGTSVSVRDLFYKTPARLKFLKSARSYRSALKILLHRYAMAFPYINFKALEDGKTFFDAPAPAEGLKASFENTLRARLQTLWPDLPESHLFWLEARHQDYHIRGLLGSPSYHYPTSAAQYMMINGRPIKDSALNWILRASFADVIPHGRFPMAALFLDVPFNKLDANVHPAKEEVRFAEPQLLKTWLPAVFKAPLREDFGRQEGARPPLETIIFKPKAPLAESSSKPPLAKPLPASPQRPLTDYAPSTLEEEAFTYQATKEPPAPSAVDSPEEPLIVEEAGPLGTAIGHIQQTYIVAENKDGLVLVDHHAAHERLTYERFKEATQDFHAESLLVPAFVQLPPALGESLVPFLPALKDKGLHIEPQTPGTFMVYSVPSLLKNKDPGDTLTHLAGKLSEIETHTEETLSGLIERSFMEILGNHACKNSLKAGDRLSLDAMNRLLRAMEKTPHSGQCNHGRPTYIVLSKRDLDKLFKRT